MKFTNLAILTILIGIVIGIAIPKGDFLSLQTSSISIAIAIFILGVHLFLSLQKSIFSKGFVFTTFLTSIAVGIFVSILHDPTTKSTHYTNVLKKQTPYLLKAKIIEQTSKSNFGTTYKADLLSADHQPTSGSILCFFPENAIQNTDFQRNDVIIFASKLNDIPIPKNPYQFDYKQYMERQDVFGLANVSNYTLISGEKSSFSIISVAENIRRNSETILETYFSKETTSLLKTLLLGNRSDLDEEVYQNYINAGAVHILAISGLHVGIITIILLYLLKKIPDKKHWKSIRFGILLVSLWSFAFIAGLSPSVLRAVTMFSFMGVASLLNRRRGRFDSLMLSMLFLLLIRPNFLYEVGFQLSYASVFSILVFYPRMERWWQPKNKIVSYFWGLLLIGFAAQIIVLPISLYYFRQFPTLFFISNLLIVPLLAPILIFGILSLICGFLNVVPLFLVSITEFLINCINTFAGLIANQEDFVIKHIYFDNKILITSVLVLITVIYLVNKVQYKRIILFLISVIIFQGVLFYGKYQSETTEEFIVFQKYKQNIFLKRKGNKITVYQPDTTQNFRLIENYQKAKGINDVKTKEIPSITDFQHKNILFVDSLGIYPKDLGLVIDNLILMNAPKVNFERMLLEIKPKNVISNGTNPPYLLKKWRETCEKQNIPFYATSEEGAFVLNSYGK